MSPIFKHSTSLQRLSREWPIPAPSTTQNMNSSGMRLDSSNPTPTTPATTVHTPSPSTPSPETPLTDNLREAYLRGDSKKELLDFSSQALRKLADEYQLNVLTPTGRPSLNKHSLVSALVTHVRSIFLSLHRLSADIPIFVRGKVSLIRSVLFT